MKVAIIGSRETGELKVEHIICRIPVNTSLIISGGAYGVDALAEKAAQILALPTRIFLPNYSLFGRQAPLVRNREIVDTADLVLAFWDNQSRGSAHALNYCIESEKPFRIFPLRELV